MIRINLSIKGVYLCVAVMVHYTSEGKISIIYINISLDFTNETSHSIICTIQARSNGFIMNDIPLVANITGQLIQSISVTNEKLIISL